MIHLTEKAAKKVKEISDEDGLGHYIIRAKVIGGGCAGFTNDLEFDSKINDDDEVTELDGVKLICDPMSFQYLDETVIDYGDGLMNAGFIFKNPNSKGSCGCGSSMAY